ncbi:carbohydrate ABC transporter permease [Quadrisphaera setariae]|uniref:Carbohydrate ABC transporter permease n=1 Tax=Quadrisphaera setariae TaxID=2593304 RepID=A0A5C8ZIL9_9ACTN|nr:carbohydrate ABC transporter permease [Quadrisphaera setariae]TXR56963.1 carbohydrate ABC transporter permease [Quadrisphaera setariae]
MAQLVDAPDRSSAAGRSKGPGRRREPRLDRVPRGRQVGRVRWYTYAVLTLAVLACLFPLYWMFVVASAGTEAAAEMPPRVVPGGRLLVVTQLVFDTIPFLRSLFNSLVVAGLIAVGQAFLCALAGFAFAKLAFKGRDALFLLLVLTMTVPASLSVIPQYMIIAQLGWVDSLQALVVPGLVSAFGIFWMRQHISATIDDQLLQAARVDGASSWQIFSKIAFPIVRPAAFVLGLLGFVNAWNDFLWPFIVLKSPEVYTAQIAIKALQSNLTVDLGLAMAGSFLVTVPLLVLFAFFGRQMVSGIMDGAFKG